MKNLKHSIRDSLDSLNVQAHGVPFQTRFTEAVSFEAPGQQKNNNPLKKRKKNCRILYVFHWSKHDHTKKMDRLKTNVSNFSIPG